VHPDEEIMTPPRAHTVGPPSEADLHGAQDADRMVAGCDGIWIAPALDTAAAVIILALPLPSESLPGPKSLKRMTAVPTTATKAVTSTGTFLWGCICLSHKSAASTRSK
jgi:hypothetical protein